MVAQPTNQLDGSGSIPASELFFFADEREDAMSLVKRYHYSHRWPHGVMAIGSFRTSGGLFGTAGEMVAACIVATPPTRWTYRVWELARLVRKDGVRVPLTKLIRLTMGLCKKRGCNLCVSFADQQQGHHGGVYRAANWTYGGLREPRMEGVMLGDSFVPGRTANSLWGTQSPTKLKTLGINVEPKYDEGKHVFYKALTKTGKEWAKELFP